MVFIEVKTKQLNCDYSLSPEEVLTQRKVRHLTWIFLSYLNQYNLEDKSWRFDLIAIELDNFNEEPVIRYYKDSFLQF